MAKHFIEDTPGITAKSLNLDPDIYAINIGGKEIRISWKSQLSVKLPLFICPDCRRKCRHLYFMDHKWSCRICHKLVYKCQWTSKWYRLVAKERKLSTIILEGQYKRRLRSKWWELLKELRAIQDILNYATLTRLTRNRTKFLYGVNNRLIQDLRG